MGKRFGLSVIFATLGFSAIGAELPCVAVQSQLRDVAGDVPSSFWACTRTSRVCIAVFYPESRVVSAASVRDLPADGAASFGVVQSPAGEEPALCLAGVFSGGSAAAWNFQGWSISAGKPVMVDGMDKSQMNSDAVPPRTLGNAIYGAYVKARK